MRDELPRFCALSATTWQNTGTYSDDKDKSDNLFYQCVGMGSVLGAKSQGNNWWCLGQTEDGSTVLWRGSENEDRSSKEEWVAGTGRYEGISGTFAGEVLTPMGKPPQGQFAACRKISGARVLP